MRTFAASGMRLFVGLAILGMTFGLALGAMLTVVPVVANHEGDGTVHACVNNSTGAMREVGDPRQCRSYEHPVELGQVVGGYEIETSDFSMSSVGPRIGGGSVNCTTGKRVLGGGLLGSTGGTPVWDILESGPITNPDGWLVTVSLPPSTSASGTVYAICANVAP